MRILRIILLLLIIAAGFIGYKLITPLKSDIASLKEETIITQETLKKNNVLLADLRLKKGNLDSEYNSIISEKNQVIKTYQGKKKWVDEQNKRFMEDMDRNIEIGDFNGNGIPDYLEH
jgi:hypothetical protein